MRHGVLRPDVVLFGEHPNRDVYGRAANAVRAAGVLSVVGTSLRVEPAAAVWPPPSTAARRW